MGKNGTDPSNVAWEWNRTLRLSTNDTRALLRTSVLAIEEGRKRNIARADRTCNRCHLGEVGDKFYIYRCTWLEKEHVDYGISVRQHKNFIKAMRDQTLGTKLFIRDAIKKIRA